MNFSTFITFYFNKQGTDITLVFLGFLCSGKHCSPYASCLIPSLASVLYQYCFLVFDYVKLFWFFPDGWGVILLNGGDCFFMALLDHFVNKVRFYSFCFSFTALCYNELFTHFILTQSRSRMGETPGGNFSSAKRMCILSKCSVPARDYMSIRDWYCYHKIHWEWNVYHKTSVQAPQPDCQGQGQ